MQQNTKRNNRVHPCVLEGDFNHPLQPAWLNDNLRKCNEGRYYGDIDILLMCGVWVFFILFIWSPKGFSAYKIVPLAVAILPMIFFGWKTIRTMTDWLSLKRNHDVVTQRFTGTLPPDWANSLRTDQAVGKVRSRIEDVVRKLEEEAPGDWKKNAADDRYTYLQIPAALAFRERLAKTEWWNDIENYHYYADRVRARNQN
jgi:hypothetical protein